MDASFSTYSTSTPHALVRGRFAPSPTGKLHAGSLTTAVGSYLEARTQGGEWLLRMEDLDPPREQAGAAADILFTLDALGFEWDGAVVYQSQRLAAYQAALDDLVAQGRAYPCACTRSDIARIAQRGIDGFVYPATCRTGLPADKSPRAWRLLVPQGDTTVLDALQAAQAQAVAHAVGDFVLKRADGFFAYQLAVVVDDAWQGITEVVRGADLLDSTPRQCVLQAALGVPRPRYAHLPLMVNAAGEKLSKQTLAPAISAQEGVAALKTALLRLNHPVPAECSTVGEVWAWASTHWRLAQVTPHAVCVTEGKTASPSESV